MNITIGIDIGGSTTKVAAMDEAQTLLGTLQVSGSDPITTAYGALGHFLRKYGMRLDQVKKIALTGQRATFFHDDIYGIPTFHSDELLSVGRGGLHLAGLSRALVVSMGTGTAFVRSDRTIESESETDIFRHLGGSALGGGTLMGLAGRMLQVRNFDTLNQMAQRGDYRRADLMVSDLQDGDGAPLSGDLTASNFGKIRDDAGDDDIAAALFHLIYENTGVFSVFALSGDSIRDVVITGSLAELPQAKSAFDVFNRMPDIFRTRFILPDHAAYAPVIGALLDPRMLNRQLPDDL